MKSTASFVLAAGLALASCRDDSSLSKQQQQYEVVQEGAATGATAALTAGQAVPPVTGTGADTTTAFQLPVPNIATTTGEQPGTIADTMTTSPGGAVPTYQPPQAGTARPAAPTRTAAAPPRPAPAPSSEPAPPPTLTGGFTSGSSRPPATVEPKPKPAEPEAEPAEDAEEEEPAEEPAPSTDTSTPPPPPGMMVGER